MNNPPQIFQLIPEQQDINQRLDKFISKYIDFISRTQIQNLIDQNLVLGNSKIIKDRSYKIKNELYQVTIPSPKKNIIAAKDIPLNIIFEDEDLIVLNKQTGLTTHPGAGNYDHTLVNALIYYLGSNLSSIGGVERPGIVHRLDKDTSGLMIVAKNNFAHQHLSQQLKKRSLKRIYHAICWGCPTPSIGTIETYIKRHHTNRLKMDVNKYDGRLAITNYKVLKDHLGKISLVECSLKTGRTHQIRVHMAHIGHPLIGDYLYGASYKNKYLALEADLGKICQNFPRQALIAKKIGFFHPKNEEYLAFEIDYDIDIGNLVDNLEL